MNRVKVAFHDTPAQLQKQWAVELSPTNQEIHYIKQK